MDDLTAPARRFRISHATVVAYLALFVAMGGTATAVSYVVSSNSQLGPGTVSGSKPTTGKHDNIINGTVNAADVADNSLGGKDIDESKLGTVPNASSVGGHAPSYFSRVIPFGVSNFIPAGHSGANVSLGAIDGLTVSASCYSLDPATINFTASSPSTVNFFHVDNNKQPGENGVALSSHGTVADAVGVNERVEGQAIYRRNSDGAVVIVTYHVFAPSCEFIGTITASG
jgi:hypothetical protein